MTSKALKIMLLVCVFLVIVVSSVQATRDKEGCTPGYWKNHEESWQCYDPNDSFADTFGVTLSNDKTLMQACCCRPVERLRDERSVLSFYYRPGDNESAAIL